MTGKMVRSLAVAALGLGSLVGVADTAQAGALAAPKITGLERVPQESLFDSQESKFAVAECPAGKRVVGGGGQVAVERAEDFNRVVLTALKPFRDTTSGVSGYFVSAAEAAVVAGTRWKVTAYAMCADASSLPGWDINVDHTAADTYPIKQKEVGCDNPSTQRVIGTGAAVSIHQASAGKVLLQTARPSATGDIARSQSQAVAGYSGSHALEVYAICMNKPQGYEVKSAPSPERFSEDAKFAKALCGNGRQLLDAGGAISNSAPGNVALQWVIPSDTTAANAQVRAVEHTPTSQNWDFITAQATCATK